jgi:hypothetical protein
VLYRIQTSHLMSCRSALAEGAAMGYSERASCRSSSLTGDMRPIAATAPGAQNRRKAVVPPRADSNGLGPTRLDRGNFYTRKK